MGVYKEGYYCLKIIEEKKQYFREVRDYATPVKKGDEVWNAIKKLCESYGVEGTRKKKTRKFLRPIEIVGTCDVFLMGEYPGTPEETYRVKYVEVKGGVEIEGEVYHGYVSVELVERKVDKKFANYDA